VPFKEFGQSLAIVWMRMAHQRGNSSSSSSSSGGGSGTRNTAAASTSVFDRSHIYAISSDTSLKLWQLDIIEHALCANS